MSMLIIFIAAVCITGLLGLGILLFWSGLCGKTIDRHPLCGKCNFDLVGHSPRPINCPECGAIIARVGGIQIGHRKLQVPKILHGSILIIINLSIVGFSWLTAEQPVKANKVVITPTVRLVPISLAVSTLSQTTINVETAGSSFKSFDAPAAIIALNVESKPLGGLIVISNDSNYASSITLKQLLLFSKQDKMLGLQAQPASGVIEKHIHKGLIGNVHRPLDRGSRKALKKGSKAIAIISKLIKTQPIATNLIKAQRTEHFALRQ